MKKIVKVVITILIILIFAIIFNCIRNYMILKKIKDAGNSIFNSQNYHITIKTTTPDINTEETFNCYNDIYYKDNICLINTYLKDKLDAVYWKNSLTNENNSFCQGKEIQFNEDLIISVKVLSTMEFINVPVFSVIFEKDGCYIIDRGNGCESLYDKRNGTLKIDQRIENNEIKSKREYTFELNTVTDEMLEKPVPIPVEEVSSDNNI